MSGNTLLRTKSKPKIFGPKFLQFRVRLPIGGSDQEKGENQDGDALSIHSV